VLSDTVSLRAAAVTVALVTGFVALIMGFVASAAHAAAAPITISPAPGTPDASPQTQISILGPARRQIVSVRVTGSRSGQHPGLLRPYTGSRGASYVLRQALTQGEHVTVVVRLHGRPRATTSFTVARLGLTLPLLNIPVLQPAKVQHFVSEPTLLPPRVTVHRSSGGGDVFLTPLPSPEVHPGSDNVLTIHPVGPGGPMIIDPHGRLVWFRQLAPPLVAANLRIQRFEGRSVLTWWQGGVTPSAFGIGEGVIADMSYRTLRAVQAGNGYSADIHEFTLTPSGDALFTVYSPVLVHLPGRPAGVLTPMLDSLVQEVDIHTGLVVWEWHAYGHVPLADSYATPATSATFDAYHLNSIQQLAGDRLLVSARDTCAVYEIDRRTGRIVWTLGGKASSFRLGDGARFFFQHDAKLLPHNQVSLFDDEAGPPIEAGSSRGLVISLNLRRRTATVASQYHRPGDSGPANSEGSFQTLPSGERFLGFGSNPFFSQFTAAGRLVFDASLPADDGSYRAYRFRWRATPATRPVAVARREASDRIAVFASWNGATTVARWEVVARSARGRQTVAGSAPHRGFETRLTVHGGARTFAVRALSRAGRILATSKDVTAG
jgi:hypothetical protein